MVTYAQAQERAEEWINGDMPSYQHRAVRVREFDLGFVLWAEDRPDGPRSDGGGQRLVIARDSGEATLWPALPVGEVIRRYEEEYGRPDPEDEPAPPAAARVDLNQTSFLLSPPEWLQEAADKLGIPDRRGENGSGNQSADAGSGSAGSGVGAAPRPGAAAAPAAAAGAGSGASFGSGSGSGSGSGAGSGFGAGSGAGSSSGSPSGSGSGSWGGGGAALPPTQGAGTAWPEAGGAARDEAPGVPSGATPWAGTDTNADNGEDRSVPLPATVFAAPLSDTSPPDSQTALIVGGSALPPTTVAPALDETGAVADPGARPASAPGAGATPPPYGPPSGQVAPPPPAAPPGATPPPQGAAVPGPPPYGYPQGPSGGPGRPPAPDAADIADAATAKAAPPQGRGRGGATPPPPPGAPGTPGVRPGTPPPPPSAGGYVPTQFGASLDLDGPAPAAPTPPGAPGGTPPGGVHHAETMLASPSVGGPGTPPPPGPPPGVPGGQGGAGAPGGPRPPGPPPGAPTPPNAPGAPAGPGGPRPPSAPGSVHHAETMLAGPPVGGPGAPPPPPGMPGAPGTPPGGPVAPGVPRPPAYGYPQQQGQPTVGPGYQAVLRYRAQDGSEQQVIRRSAPGTPHPEWQIFHELRGMNVPPDQVLELHTELESCELPGAYCARMIREQWPQARITSIAPYGTDHASRQQGMGQLLAHQGELHQVADGPARPAPVRAPIPPVQPAPPVPPEAIAQDLAAAFGPGMFRFEQAAVSRQGVPPVVAHSLVVAGLPLDMGPFFWAQAQPGRPVPTLAELAQERGVLPASDAGSYLVMGSDFGKAVCVQYGTANIVAVPVEAGPGGAPVAPQFVNTGLPEFQRCLALLGRMWRLRFGLNQEQAGRWTVDFQAQLASLDPAALGSPESWWSVLLEQMWDGLL
ncbi:SUKH-4 family immunity protein [Streptomyces doudnae]|uniref:SUKH-4 family immunity protein n=2 Tax=Streptomyces TaxID=1883 RepID=A0ABD5ET98_9ACTN|nr:SUKH-4 family immunity protein [Streptomyces sp. DSM 41981]MDT0437933.1 SUKH-4 family immunity protein [Streptomyces sp. DSM 41981]